MEGWRLVGVLSAVIVLVTLGFMFWHRFEVEGVRLVIRSTARTSLLLFCLAMSASALYRRWPNARTRWLRQNRRYLGISFAVSHLVHAIGIASFGLLDPVNFRQSVSVGSFVFGGTAYAFIIAMTATSFDRTAAWIGARKWRVLHSTGAYFILVTFLISVGKRAVNDLFYWPFIVLIIAVIVIRFAGHRVLRVSAAGSAR
jgi:hypothetical protein